LESLTLTAESLQLKRLSRASQKCLTPSRTTLNARNSTVVKLVPDEILTTDPSSSRVQTLTFQ
jgi:hypothetical protein